MPKSALLNRKAVVYWMIANHSICLHKKLKPNGTFLPAKRQKNNTKTKIKFTSKNDKKKTKNKTNKYTNTYWVDAYWFFSLRCCCCFPFARFVFMIDTFLRLNHDTIDIEWYQQGKKANAINNTKKHIDINKIENEENG